MERSNTPHSLRFFIFILFVLAPRLDARAMPPAENLFTPENFERIQNIIDSTILQNYDKALRLSREIQQEYPKHPGGYFFEAAALQAMMMDFENDEKKEYFFQLTAKVNKLCKSGLRRTPKNSWLYFLMGGALGYEAYIQGREQNYLRAFDSGWNSIQCLETAISLDSTNYDAYLGIGTYKYYRSKLSHFLTWMPFVKDERETGIELIERAIVRGKLSSAAATNALIWIYYEEEKYALADSLIDGALAKYPGSRFFLWGRASVAMKRKDWQGAETAYKQILLSYKKQGKRSHYNELVCHTRLAKIYSMRDDGVLAGEHAQKALAIEIPKARQKKAQKHRKLAEDILKQVGQHIEEP